MYAVFFVVFYLHDIAIHWYIIPELVTYFDYFAYYYDCIE